MKKQSWSGPLVAFIQITYGVIIRQFEPFGLKRIQFGYIVRQFQGFMESMRLDSPLPIPKRADFRLRFDGLSSQARV